MILKQLFAYHCSLSLAIGYCIQVNSFANSLSSSFFSTPPPIHLALFLRPLLFLLIALCPLSHHIVYMPPSGTAKKSYSRTKTSISIAVESRTVHMIYFKNIMYPSTLGFVNFVTKLPQPH